MSIDFSSMQVGDKVKMPGLRWAIPNGELTENQKIYAQANEYARSCDTEPRPQFQADGNDLDGRGYWLTRIR